MTVTNGKLITSRGFSLHLYQQKFHGEPIVAEHRPSVNNFDTLDLQERTIRSGISRHMHLFPPLPVTLLMVSALASMPSICCHLFQQGKAQQRNYINFETICMRPRCSAIRHFVPIGLTVMRINSTTERQSGQKTNRERVMRSRHEGIEIAFMHEAKAFQTVLVVLITHTQSHVGCLKGLSSRNRSSNFFIQLNCYRA